VQIAVCRDLKATAIDILDDCWIIFSVISRDKKCRRNLILLEKIEIAWYATPARIASPGIDAQWPQLAADFM
jgi:hypothetical protein